MIYQLKKTTSYNNETKYLKYNQNWNIYFVHDFQILIQYHVGFICIH